MGIRDKRRKRLAEKILVAEKAEEEKKTQFLTTGELKEEEVKGLLRSLEKRRKVLGPEDLLLLRSLESYLWHSRKIRKGR
jgi:hypothetical protein